jgi:IclR family acetate operon transcriptional repressor
VGKAMLAELPLSELERRYSDADLGSGTPAAITDRAVLEAELDEIRRQGYALNWEESAEGVSAVAVALQDTGGAPVAALGIAAPSSRMGSIESVRAFAPALLSAAEKVRALLRDPG